MKVKITSDQLHLLTSHFYLIEGRGLEHHYSSRLTESRLKEYLVKVIVGGMIAQIRIGAHNGTNALILVKKLFPKANVVGSYIQV